MGKVILDTDMLSEYLKGHDRIVAGHALRYAQSQGVFTFTSVTIYEIVFGLEVKAATAQLKKALAWMAQNDQITPTQADYLAAATIRSAARRQGSVLDLPDCLIAAVAIRLDLTLNSQYGRFSGVQKTDAKLAFQNWRIA